MEAGRLNREMDTLRLELRIANHGAGVRLLGQIFKRWTHLAVWGVFSGMKAKFIAEYADFKMARQLKGMDARLRHEVPLPSPCYFPSSCDRYIILITLALAGDCEAPIYFERLGRKGLCGADV